MDNQEIFNEAFFKKQSYTDRLKKMLPEYEPEDKKSVGTPGLFNAVSNIDELKKRLVSSFGAIVGNNTIKTMANKAIKTFPIIISDNIDPETAVLIKRTTEEQYAQYIELLISNQIIDASQYVAGDSDSGNIAIQALDTISGADFSKKQGLGTKLAKGEVDLNTLAKNNLLYNLIRQEDYKFEIDDAFAASILEDAVVIPSDKSDLLVEFINENFENINEYVREIDPIIEKKNDEIKKEKIDLYVKKGSDSFEKFIDRVNSSDKNDPYLDLTTLYPQDKNGKDVIEKTKFDKAMERTVQSILNDNPALRDRFEKACFLLYSYKISGIEFLSYVSQRLGIPVPEATRRELVIKYTPDNIRHLEDRFQYGTGKGFKAMHKDQKLAAGGLFTPEDIQKISNSQSLNSFSGAVDKILNMKFKTALSAAGITLGAGGAIASIAAASAIVSWPFLLAGSLALLSASAIYALKQFTKKKKMEASIGKLNGWERVESLINIMELQQKDVQKAYEAATGLRDAAPDYLLSSDDLKKAINNFYKKIFKEDSLNLFGASPYDLSFNISINEDFIEPNSNGIELAPVKIDLNLCQDFIRESTNCFNEIVKDLEANDKEYKALCFQESIISTSKPIVTTFPIKAVKNYEFNPKSPTEVTVAPEFSFRNRKAYGSVEYDTKQIKDRRYNQPLIMKINFRERYSDGTFSDNEMTAVIGILGVVTRVPSEEMKEILRANADGETIKGIFRPEDGKAPSIIDLFGLAKKSKPKIVQSSEVWENLEKVSKLALINRVAGRQTNNIANAHIVFSQKEIDEIRVETGADYLRDKKLAAQLMKRYNAFAIMVANDIGERLYIFDDLDAISWNVIPYSAIRTRDSQDQLTAALTKISDRR